MSPRRGRRRRRAAECESRRRERERDHSPYHLARRRITYLLRRALGDLSLGLTPPDRLAKRSAAHGEYRCAALRGPITIIARILKVKVLLMSSIHSEYDD